MYPRGHRTNLPPLLRVLPGYMVTTTLWGKKKSWKKQIGIVWLLNVHPWKKMWKVIHQDGSTTPKYHEYFSLG